MGTWKSWQRWQNSENQPNWNTAGLRYLSVRQWIATKCDFITSDSQEKVQII